MKKINHVSVAWFAAVVVIVFAVAVALKGRDEFVFRGSSSVATSTVAEGGAPDSIATSSLTDGDVIVADAPAGYYFSMPSNWYMEDNAGAGVTVYPDYSPATASSSPARCKIEITGLAAAKGIDLNAWITQNLHVDPTASVAEISRTPMKIDGNSGIMWRGVLNGVTTTLVYVPAPNGTMFEIAPSTLSEASDADNDDCNLDLQALVANFTFGSYEP